MRSECLESAESRSRDTLGIPAGWAVSDMGSRIHRSPAPISTKPSCYSTRRALHTGTPRSSRDSCARRLRFPQNIPVGGVLLWAGWRLAVEIQENTSRPPVQLGTHMRLSNRETPHDQNSHESRPFPRARSRWPSGFAGNYGRWQGDTLRMPGFPQTPPPPRSTQSPASMPIEKSTR